MLGIKYRYIQSSPLSKNITKGEEGGGERQPNLSLFCQKRPPMPNHHKYSVAIQNMFYRDFFQVLVINLLHFHVSGLCTAEQPDAMFVFLKDPGKEHNFFPCLST
jgi:hypothetical protein